MNRDDIRRIGRSLAVALLLAFAGRAGGSTPCGGELRIVGPDGQPAGACPLKYTDVVADIAGFVGRTMVRQTFHNPTDTKIEAIYVFPLPDGAAVDDMVMFVGDRKIVAQIHERSEARQIYEDAKTAGHVASLLDQERPNIFTQSVANIEPGVEVVIEISYTETIAFKDGRFEWVFPTVVAPRYIPGDSPRKPLPIDTDQPADKPDAAPQVETGNEPQGTGRSPDTDQVPDASKISPPVNPKGMRAGHDISITVNLDAGVGAPGLFDVKSELHEIAVQTQGPNRATVTLAKETAIPNRDFVLQYRLTSDEIGDAFLVHSDERGQFFMLTLEPPQRVLPDFIVPRELIFVLDTSGSMSGFPIEKAKEVMSRAIDAMQPEDTFNLITFAGDTNILWETPRPNNDQNRAEAQQFVASRGGGGGTEMMTAINAALVQPAGVAVGSTDEPTHLPIRVVCFLTDGQVGNDFAIIDAVKQNAGTTRVFSFGIGNSINRFLLDGMARAGRGEVEYVTLESEAGEAVERFAERITAPVLTNVSIDWGGLPVADVYPVLIPDLFAAKPIMVHGRLTGTPAGTITLRGQTGAGPLEDRIEINSDQFATDHEALASLWARAKVDDLMMQDMAAAQNGQVPEAIKQQIIALGTEYRLMTQFTSFVAVEEMTVTIDGQPVKTTVPVEMPEGQSYEGTLGLDPSYVGRQLQSLGYVGGPDVGDFNSSPPNRPKRKKMPSPPTEMPSTAGGGGAGGGSIFGGGGDEPDAGDFAFSAVKAPDKLASSLRGLAVKVESEGKDGNLSIDKLHVKNWRVAVKIRIAEASEQTIKSLAELGFVRIGESRAVKLLMGTIDVRQLGKLVELNAVLSVEPIEY